MGDIFVGVFPYENIILVFVFFSWWSFYIPIHIADRGIIKTFCLVKKYNHIIKREVGGWMQDAGRGISKLVLLRPFQGTAKLGAKNETNKWADIGMEKTEAKKLEEIRRNWQTQILYPFLLHAALRVPHDIKWLFSCLHHPTKGSAINELQIKCSSSGFLCHLLYKHFIHWSLK